MTLSMLVCPSVTSKKILHFLWSELKPHFHLVLLSIPFGAIAALTQVATAHIGGDFVKNALIDGNADHIKISCIAIVIIFTIQSLSLFANNTLIRVCLERLTRDLRNKIFNRFLIFSESVTANFGSGKALSHIINDIQTIGTGRYIVGEIIRHPLAAVGLASYILWLNWKLALICIVVIFPLAFIVRKIGDSAKRNQRRVQESLDDLSQHTIESIRGVRTAHSYGIISRLKNSFHHFTHTSYRHLVKLCLVEEGINPVTKIFTSVAGAAALGYGAHLVIVEKLMGVDEVLQFLFAAGLMQQPIRQLNHLSVRLQEIIACGGRVLEVIETDLDTLSRDQEKHIDSKSPSLNELEKFESLKINQLSFHYPIAQKKQDAIEIQTKAALENINFSISPGEKIAFVGKSGSGKSTLMSLIMRFMDPQRGDIQLNSKVSTDWPLLNYRAYFSYVSQDVFLFNKSLRENLLIANPNAKEEDLWKALELVNLKGLVENLNDQLDSPIYEQAKNFSGGEKQRLSIARAFLRNSPILLLDEATSALDSTNEKIIQSSLEEIVKGKTVLTIAHRLSTIKNCDKIYVFENGSIIESGSPSQLIEKDGSFSKLWKDQGLN